MASERNALAELAENIGCLGKLHYSAGVIQTDELTPRDYSVIDKAQRIIAELAKVEFIEYSNLVCDPGQAVGAVEDCRTIAEEGVKR